MSSCYLCYYLPTYTLAMRAGNKCVFNEDILHTNGKTVSNLLYAKHRAHLTFVAKLSVLLSSGCCASDRSEVIVRDQLCICQWRRLARTPLLKTDAARRVDLTTVEANERPMHRTRRTCRYDDGNRLRLLQTRPVFRQHSNRTKTPQNQTPVIFTARRHASVVVWPSVCLSVCHKSVFYWNG